MFNRNVFLYWICVSYSHSPRHRTLLSISFGHAYNLGLFGTFHEQRDWMAGMVTVPLTWDAGKYSQISQRHITRPEMIAKWWDESPFPVQHSLLPLKLPHPLQPTQALLTHLLDQLDPPCLPPGQLQTYIFLCHWTQVWAHRMNLFFTLVVKGFVDFS